MYNANPLRVFISHTTSDHAFAHTLAQELRGVLLDEQCVWFDDHRILPGENWQERIRKEVDTSQVFIIVLSPTSVISKPVLWELDLALAHGLANPQKAVIGALIQNCSIPTTLNDHHIVPFAAPHQHKDAIGRLLTILWQVLRGREPERGQSLLTEPSRDRFWNTGNALSALDSSDSTHRGEEGGDYTAANLLDLLPERRLVRLFTMPVNSPRERKPRELIAAYLRTLGARHTVAQEEQRRVLSAAPALSLHDNPGQIERIPAYPSGWSAPDGARWSAGQTSEDDERANALGAETDWLDLPDLPAPVTTLDDVNESHASRRVNHERYVMRQARQHLVDKKPFRALAILRSMPERDSDETRGHAMRWRFLWGVAHVQASEQSPDAPIAATLTQAIEAFRESLMYAVTFGDTESQVVIFVQLAGVYQRASFFEQAVNALQTALGLIQPLPRTVSHVRAELAIRARLALHLFLLGRFPEALRKLSVDRDVERELNASALAPNDVWYREWLAALIHRALSRSRGGDIRQLGKSLDLFERAQARLAGSEITRNGETTHLARLRVQLAETLLDLAALYRGRSAERRVNAALEKAMICASMASDSLRRSLDETGASLATLTLLRWDVFNAQAQELTPIVGAEGDDTTYMIDRRLDEIERRATDSHNQLLLAHVLTLRADLLAARSDITAQALYYKAINAFDQAGARGEATRAIYGVRLQLGLL